MRMMYVAALPAPTAAVAEAAPGAAHLVALVQHGILASSHLLALMYAGELCFWAFRLAVRQGDRLGGAAAEERAAAAADAGLCFNASALGACSASSARGLGMALLARYVRAVTGTPELRRSWDVVRALELMKAMKRAAMVAPDAAQVVGCVSDAVPHSEGEA